MRPEPGRRSLFASIASVAAVIAASALTACSGNGGQDTLPAAAPGSTTFAQSATVTSSFGIADATSASRSAAPVTLTWLKGAPAAGDLLVACAESQYQATPQTPAGWTSLNAMSTNRYGTALFYKIAGSGEPTSVLFAIPSRYNISAAMVRITGASAAAPLWSHTSNSGVGTLATQPIVPNVLGMLPLACFGGVNAKSYSVATGWSLDTQSGGGYATMIEQRQSATTDTHTAISVAATAASISKYTFNDGYGVLVAPASTTAPGGVTVTPASIAFTAVAAPAQTVTATQPGTTTFAATSTNCNAVATIASIGNGQFRIAPVGVGSCAFTIAGSGGRSVTLPVSTTSTVLTLH